MKLRILNPILFLIFIISMLLLFWPFAVWGPVLSLLLRIAAAFSVQLLMYRICRYPILKSIPFLVTGLLALWGAWLFCTSPHWSNVGFGDYLTDYLSPFLSCAAAVLLCRITGTTGRTKLITPH